jgi:hypothetical protein
MSRAPAEHAPQSALPSHIRMALKEVDSLAHAEASVTSTTAESSRPLLSRGSWRFTGLPQDGQVATSSGSSLTHRGARIALASRRLTSLCHCCPTVRQASGWSRHLTAPCPENLIRRSAAKAQLVPPPGSSALFAAGSDAGDNRPGLVHDRSNGTLVSIAGLRLLPWCW